MKLKKIVYGSHNTWGVQYLDDENKLQLKLVPHYEVKRILREHFNSERRLRRLTRIVSNNDGTYSVDGVREVFFNGIERNYWELFEINSKQEEKRNKDDGS